MGQLNHAPIHCTARHSIQKVPSAAALKAHVHATAKPVHLSEANSVQQQQSACTCGKSHRVLLHALQDQHR